ncbi:neuropeptide Y receptor type 6 [Hydra vulgaris]|uniref:Neuropeptide Y receptor type 6 n=1 Tax=Hydra vulgaris TaxID=6087 RepID=A0ABM4CBN4_HYDVU
MAKDIQTAILTSLNSFIVVGGVIGNMFIVVLIAQKKKLQNITNILVTNLAVASIAISAIVIPFSMAMGLKYWTPNKLKCKILMPIFEHFAGVCVLTHTAISISRYMIVNQLRIIQEIKVRSVALIIALLWAISFIIISVPLMGLLGEFTNINGLKFNNTTHASQESGTCELDFPKNTDNEQIYAVMIFSLTYLIPMVCTGFSYLKIQRVVADNAKSLKGHVPGDLIALRKRSSKRLNRTLLTMYLFFGLTTLPIQALYLVNAFIKDKFFNRMWNISFTLFYLQVVTNPLVFLYKGAMYRKELYKLSVCFFLPKRVHNASRKLKGSLRISGGKYFRKTSMNDIKKLLNDRGSPIARNSYENRNKNKNYPLKPELNISEKLNPKAPANNNIFSTLNVYQSQSKDMKSNLSLDFPNYYSPILESHSSSLSFNQNQFYSSKTSIKNKEISDTVCEEQRINELLIFIESLSNEENSYLENIESVLRKEDSLKRETVL